MNECNSADSPVKNSVFILSLYSVSTQSLLSVSLYFQLRQLSIIWLLALLSNCFNLTNTEHRTITLRHPPLNQRLWSPFFMMRPPLRRPAACRTVCQPPQNHRAIIHLSNCTPIIDTNSSGLKERELICSFTANRKQKMIFKNPLSLILDSSSQGVSLERKRRERLSSSIRPMRVPLSTSLWHTHESGNRIS